MLIKKTVKKTLTIEQVENVQCDLCQKKIFSKNTPTGEMATLALSIMERSGEDVLDNEETLQESTDLCLTCYKKTIAFLKMNGAKVPSFFSNPDFEEPESETATQVLNS